MVFATSVAEMHLTDDVLESIALNRLKETNLGPAEEHLLLCPECRSRLETMGEYCCVMGATLRRSAPNVVFWQLHITKDGPIQIWVEKVPTRGWRSRRIGRNLDGGIETTSQARALVDAFESFRELFPEHECSDGCILRR